MNAEHVENVYTSPLDCHILPGHQDASMLQSGCRRMQNQSVQWAHQASDEDCDHNPNTGMRTHQ